jgi:hypothetical protein
MEGFNRNANRVMNSLVPLGAANNSSSSSAMIYTVISIVLTIIIFVSIFYYFQDSIRDLTNAAMDTISGYFATPTPPLRDSSGNYLNAAAPAPAPADAPAPSSTPSPSPSYVPSMPSLATSTAEKILPGVQEVFNVSSNKFTYYDAEPLCKALGAELATYDQVKDAWTKGADWCNYGWIKGQMAVYPTSDETYQKNQKGPAEQQLACGRPGVNGGYFDNPELRYGVTCYGSKPSQSKHDEARAAMATPVSPDAVEFDKKVAQFKSEADVIGILPFNSSKWQ